MFHIDLRRVKEHALHEIRRPVHLHLNDELALVVRLAIHINNAVLPLLGAWHSLRRKIVYVGYLLALLQREQGVEQTHHQVGMLAEYLLESQVGFRV